MGRGRGRGSARGRELRRNPGRPPSDLAAARAQTITFPVTAQDDEIVECSECDMTSTFREFRLHNIEAHYNIAKTTSDPAIQDHKYFTRKLMELAKLTKITSFFCPRKPCEATYKSALGLAYHLDGCGKSAEEIAARLIECDICHKKYAVPSMSWHKRNAHPTPVSEVLLPYPDDVDASLFTTPRPSGKRKSAMKALEFMKEMSDLNIKVEQDDEARKGLDDLDEDFALAPYHFKREQDDAELDEEDEVDDENNIEVTPSIDFILGVEEVKAHSGHTKMASGSTPSLRPDFAAHASRYIESNESANENPWDTPTRITEDPFRTLSTNSLNAVCSSKIRNYLPLNETSIQFNARTKPKSSKDTEPFHRLDWFEGEVTNIAEHDFLTFTGGPISALAWHPSGDYLAVATLRELSEAPNLIRTATNPSSIQIYVKSPVEVDGPVFSLRLVLCSDFGYVNNLKWSSFWPVVTLSVENLEEMEENRIGYLAAAFADSTCRVYTLRLSDFDLRPTFATELNFGKNLPVYTKVPEITLKIEEDLNPDISGQCMCFDWDETSRFLVTGYASGHIAVFNLLSTSCLLRKMTQEENNCSIYFNPMWLITSHFAPVTAIVIDPKSSRYFYTGSIDRTLRTWDMDLRQEMECKKVGCVTDMCWIRGWIHLGVIVDSAVANPSSQYNFLRFHSVGSSQSRPNTVEYFNITSTSFFEGMVLTGSENGRVSISYYDAFWRECDYDRNKKKKNVINIGKVIIDQSTFEPVPFAKCDEDIQPFPEEEPRLTFVFCRDRVQGSQEVEPSRDEVENIYRFQKHVRVNKVSWAPNGKYITIGYRNGLFAIIPADFDKLFA